MNEFINLMQAIDEYLDKNDHNFHNRLFIIYCHKCEMVTKAGGDYTITAGNDCLGTHYETVKQDEHCLSCNGNYYEKIIPLSCGGLAKLTPQQMIKAIDKSSNELFNFPTLYNKNLPSIMNEWKKLSLKTKIKQINDVKKHCKKITSIRKHLEEAEKLWNI
jgi:hypothetical protein